MTAFIVTAMALIGSVHATNLQPAEGDKACVAREYSAAHMQAHPKQALNSMTVIIESVPGTPATNNQSYRTVKVVGERKGKLYANEAWCDYKKDGSVDCQIECDGGAFSLTPQGTSALFKVRKDYYFPLFVEGSDPEAAGPEETLPLQYEDVENRVYKLFPANVPACERIWERYKSAEHGC